MPRDRRSAAPITVLGRGRSLRPRSLVHAFGGIGAADPLPLQPSQHPADAGPNNADFTTYCLQEKAGHTLFTLLFTMLERVWLIRQG